LKDIGKVKEIEELTRGKGLILPIDSNSRSKLWHDTYTNQRGKTLEEFTITSDLLLMNEVTVIPTEKTVQIQATKLLNKQSSQNDSNFESTG
jgi:hypothetical protein